MTRGNVTPKTNHARGVPNPVLADFHQLPAGGPAPPRLAILSEALSSVSYEPKPVDTSHITLPAGILELTERLARNAHDIWARQRLADGWRFGVERNDQRKEHPCLVPYDELPESERQYDRHAALESLKTVIALGYRISPPESPSEKA